MFLSRFRLESTLSKSKKLVLYTLAFVLALYVSWVGITSLDPGPWLAEPGFSSGLGCCNEHECYLGMTHLDLRTNECKPRYETENVQAPDAWMWRDDLLGR